MENNNPPPKFTELLANLEERCSQEEDIYEMATSSTDAIQHRLPYSQVSFTTALPSLMEVKSASARSTCKSFNDACYQTSLKDVPENADMVRLNVMLQRIRTIHRRVLEENVLCSTLPELMEDCTNKVLPPVSLERVLSVVRDASTQTSAADRGVFVDMALIENLMKTYERYHDMMVDDIRDRLARMEEVLATKNGVEPTKQLIEPSLSTTSQRHATRWWHWLLCMGTLQFNKSDHIFTS